VSRRCIVIVYRFVNWAVNRDNDRQLTAGPSWLSRNLQRMKNKLILVQYAKAVVTTMIRRSTPIRLQFDGATTIRRPTLWL